MGQIIDHSDEIVRLLAMRVRQDFETQDQAILAFSRAGFGPKRVAELLGTTANTVNQSLQRAKKPKGKTVAKSKRSAGER